VGDRRSESAGEAALKSCNRQTILEAGSWIERGRLIPDATKYIDLIMGVD
jgi:hypothetical protein